MIPQEIEAKLMLASAADAGTLAELRRLDSYELRPLPTQQLRSIYLDTPSFSLARHGVALRVRRDKTSWEATAKWGGRIEGAVHERTELTVPLSGRPRFPFVLPSGALALQLTALVAGGALKPILETSIRRERRHVVATGTSVPLAELAIDCVTHRRADTRLTQPPYWELEIELVGDSKADLMRVTRLVRARVHSTTSEESKFTRGMRLFHPTVHPQRAPQRPAPADTTAHALRLLVARQLTRVQLYDPPTRIGKDPDAVHDMRVALRRLRAVLRTFKRGCAKPTRTQVVADLRWIEQVLGGVRDVDVQLAHLAKLDGRPTHAAIAPLRDHLIAVRRRRQAALKAALNAPRYGRLLAALDTLVTTPVPPDLLPHGSEPVARAGRRALRNRLRVLRRDGRRAMRKQTDERLHALRIATKRIRYVLEFLENLTGKPGKRLTKTLIELQDELGMQHDAIVAMSTIEEILRRRGASGSPATVASLQHLVAREKRAAAAHRRAATVVWGRFSGRQGRTDVDAVLDTLADLEEQP